MAQRTKPLFMSTGPNVVEFAVNHALSENPWPEGADSLGREAGLLLPFHLRIQRERDIQLVFAADEPFDSYIWLLLLMAEPPVDEEAKAYRATQQPSKHDHRAWHILCRGGMGKMDESILLEMGWQPCSTSRRTVTSNFGDSGDLRDRLVPQMEELFRLRWEIARRTLCATVIEPSFHGVSGTYRTRHAIPVRVGFDGRDPEVHLLDT